MRTFDFLCAVATMLGLLGCGPSPGAPCVPVDEGSCEEVATDEKSLAWYFAMRSGPDERVRIGHVTVVLPGVLPDRPVANGIPYYGIQFGGVRVWAGSVDTVNNSERQVLAKWAEQTMLDRTANDARDVIVHRSHSSQPEKTVVRVISGSEVIAEAYIIPVEPHFAVLIVIEGNGESLAQTADEIWSTLEIDPIYPEAKFIAYDSGILVFETQESVFLISEPRIVQKPQPVLRINSSRTAVEALVAYEWPDIEQHQIDQVVSRMAGRGEVEVIYYHQLTRPRLSIMSPEGIVVWKLDRPVPLVPTSIVFEEGTIVAEEMLQFASGAIVPDGWLSIFEADLPSRGIKLVAEIPATWGWSVFLESPR